MIQLIALDIDGTLLNSTGQITYKTRTTLQQATDKGIHIVLCTGRPYCGVHSVLQQLDLNQRENYCVSFNGGLITDLSTNEHIVSHSLSYSDYLYFHSLASNYNLSMQGMTVDTIITSSDSLDSMTIMESDVNQMPISIQPLDTINPSITFGNIMLLGETTRLHYFMSHLPKRASDYSYSFSSKNFIEFMHPKATKATALAELATQLQLSCENILAIGDGNNDIPMFHYAGKSVAMGNASDEVKAITQFVTASNDHDGVALAIDRLIQ